MHFQSWISLFRVLFLVCLNFKRKCQLGQSRSPQCVAGFIMLEMTIVMKLQHIMGI